MEKVEAKGRPKGVRRVPKVCLGAGFGDQSVGTLKFGLILVPFLMKKTIKKRCARTLYSSTRKWLIFRCKNSLEMKRKNDVFRFSAKWEPSFFDVLNVSKPLCLLCRMHVAQKGGSWKKMIFCGRAVGRTYPKSIEKSDVKCNFRLHPAIR